MAISNIPSSAADAGAAVPPVFILLTEHDQTLKKIGEALSDEDVLALRELLKEDHTGELLGEAFCFYAEQHENTPVSDEVEEEIRVMLQRIPANGQWGLGHILQLCMQSYRPDTLRLIQELPRFAEILPNAPFGLGNALTFFLGHRRIDGDYPGFLNAVINHPHADEIRLYGNEHESIGKNLFNMVRNTLETIIVSDKDAAISLLNPRISSLLSPNGPYGLGRILFCVAYTTIPDVVRAVLNHPLARHINSKETETTEKIEVEKGYGINRFGLKEALFAATHTTAGPEQNRIQIVRDILQAMEARTEEVDPNAPFSIAEALGEAGRNNPDAVPILLDSPLSQEIRVEESHEKKEYGGLSPTLLGAAERGHLAAVEAVLRHPKAYEVPPEDYSEAISEAAKNGHDNIVDLIREYHSPIKPAAAKPAATPDNKPSPAEKE